jgi:predicted Zn-ribbon and HTH transcriptional regulator
MAMCLCRRPPGKGEVHSALCRRESVVNSNRKPCEDCGYPFTQPAGACTLCPECGTSSGCS